MAKPTIGATLLPLDSGINSACAGAWLLGDGPKFYRDSSKNGRDATLATGAYPTSLSGPGRLGGNTFRMLAPGGLVLSTANYTPPTGNLTVTIFCWANDWHNYSPLISQWNEGATKRSWAVVGFADKNLYCYSSSNGSAFRVYGTTSAPLPVNNWIAISVVYQASGSPTLIYLNGVAQSTTTSGTEAYLGLYNTSQPIYIGYSPLFAGSTWGCNARLESARIDERALSADEIAYLHRDQFGAWQRERPKTRYFPFAAPASSGYPRTILY